MSSVAAAPRADRAADDRRVLVTDDAGPVRRLGADPRRGSRLSVGDEVVDDGPRRRRLVEPGSRLGSIDEGCRRGRLRLPARRRRDAAARPALAASARTACTSGPAPSTRTPSRGPTRRGPGASWPARSSTSCTSARSRPRAPSTPRSGRLDHLRSIGVDLVELMPVNSFNGDPQLGLRRGRLVRRRRDVRRPGGVPALRRRLPRRRARRRAGRGPQPPRPVRELPAAVRAVPQGRGREQLGRPREPRRRRARARCGATSSTTR